MTSIPSPPPSRSPRVRAVMKGNRSRDTLPELRLRSLLHAEGLRFRVDYPIAVASRRVRVDIAFTRRRVVVFVDGCFWHGCYTHPKPSRTNLPYWDAKIAVNRARDTAQTEALRRAGWIVVRGWEHEPPIALAERIKTALSLAAATSVWGTGASYQAHSEARRLRRATA